MSGFFETLIRPDYEEQTERTEISRAANMLQVGEFQFLQLAYSEWHNEDMGEPTANTLFADYMLHNKVPHWARHYARSIIRLERKNELDDLDPKYHRYDSDFKSSVPQGVIKFCASVVVVVFFIGGLLWIAHVVAPGGATSVLPPYFFEKDIKPNDTHLAPGQFR